MSAEQNKASAQAAMEAATERFGLGGSVSLGVDIVEIERMRAILERSPAFARRAFSADERAYADATPTPAYHYATRFAAKEAVLKALGTGFSHGIGPRDVEVVLNAAGKPFAKLYGNAAAVARSKRVTEIPISLSYTHAEAVACAMAITADAVEKAKKPEDPAKQLSRRFKEARKLLDDDSFVPPAKDAARADGGLRFEAESDVAQAPAQAAPHAQDAGQTSLEDLYGERS